MLHETPEEIVRRQADDEGLWFVAETAPEAYLQAALRALHAAIEAEAEVETSVTSLTQTAKGRGQVGRKPTGWSAKTRRVRH